MIFYKSTIEPGYCPDPEHLREGNKAEPAGYEHLPVLCGPAADRAEPEVPGVRMRQMENIQEIMKNDLKKIGIGLDTDKCPRRTFFNPGGHSFQ